MYIEHAFVLLFSHFYNVSDTSMSVVSELDCAVMCVKREDCSSFFYNDDTKSCLASTNRHLTPTQLSFAQGYKYHIMRPDCEVEWTVIGGQCYLLRTDKQSAENAQSTCEGLGGSLAKTDSTLKNIVIKSVSQKSGTVFWIGGSDQAEEGTWVWRDGSPVTLSLWKPRENNNIGEEDCMLQSDEGWYDISCNLLRSYLCEK